MKIIVLILLILQIGAAQAEADPSPFFFKTRTESFTDKFFFKIENGKILVNEKGQRAWLPFGGTGLPFDEKKQLAQEIVEISADGENLIATDQSGQVFYTKIGKIKWNEKWGKPLAQVLHLEENLAWGISHRGPFMQYYSDVHGNQHPIFAGVSTLYLLRKNGHEIVYVDPWIPAKWWHQVDLPLKGRMHALNMTVAGSTLFIINNKGEMFTRLYDYDTSGQNPILPYSYDNEKREGTRKIIRSLPAEDWKQQPTIKNGMITSRITILQTGEKGNGAFELRVEGIDAQGMTGFYSKKILEEGDWKFTSTGLKLSGKLLDTVSDRIVTASKTKNYKGQIVLKKNQKYSVELLDCSPLISPATVRFHIGELSFDFLYHMRRYKYVKEGMEFKSTLQISDEFIKSPNPEVQKVWKELFRHEKFIDFHAAISGQEFKAKENLHQMGVDKVADVLSWKLGYRFSKVLLKAKFHRRLKMTFSQI